MEVSLGCSRTHMAPDGRADSGARVLIGCISLPVTDRIADNVMMMAGWLRGWLDSRLVVRSDGMDGDGRVMRPEFRGYTSLTRDREMRVTIFPG